EAAARGFVQFLESNPRYAEALKHKHDPARFADELAKAGYATDPQYAGKLKGVLTGSAAAPVYGEVAPAEPT
ncbi:MAG: glucosaminidase domain-containing protein, partial [Mycobacterium sp.]